MLLAETYYSGFLQATKEVLLEQPNTFYHNELIEAQQVCIGQDNSKEFGHVLQSLIVAQQACIGQDNSKEFGHVLQSCLS
jgi:hypothetical protein